MTTIPTRSNAIPATMRAFAIDHYGDTGHIRELPTPRVGPGKILVRVRAAGVNPFDLKVRAGGKPEVNQRFPLILGQDAHPKGIDAVIDLVSNATTLLHLGNVLREGGRVVSSIHASELAAVFAEHFRRLGGKITSEEAVAPTDTDMRPVLARIATGRPAMVYYPIFVAPAARIARQAKGISGLEKSMLVGSSALLTADFLAAAGEAAVGFRFTSPDVSPEAFGKDYPAFVKKYKEKYGEGPVQAYHAYAYDGALVAFRTITKIAKQDAQGNTYIGRKALRDAIFATKGHPELTGTLTCDPQGDCGVFKPAVYQYTNADPKTFKLGTNPIKLWPK